MPNTQINLLQSCLNYLAKIIKARLHHYFDDVEEEVSMMTIPLPEFNGTAHPLLHFSRKHQLNQEEFVLLLIGLTPHIDPVFFDKILQQTLPQSGDFPEFGGTRGKNFRGFLPTAETAIFLLGREDLQKRLDIQQLFSAEHLFAKKRILWIADVPEGEPRMSGKIILSPDYLELFTTGKVSRPHFSMNFPAQLLETNMDWEDLVLNNKTMSEIMELERWLKYGQTLLDDWGMAKKINPGYRVLFHGPPGTGKTLTASLLGKHTGKDVFKIDLSMVVSKFIGETEKNLANLFAKAENKDWILFFDEADALFGKRTNVRDAHDKYANQEVSYLLQRVEHYNGLVILASNFKTNIDDAFIRRFQSIVHFPLPKTNERLQIWQKAFPPNVQISPNTELRQIAQKYELSGAEIMNIVQYCCLVAMERKTTVINQQQIIEGIRREYFKEGKIMR